MLLGAAPVPRKTTFRRRQAAARAVGGKEFSHSWCFVATGRPREGNFSGRSVQRSRRKTGLFGGGASIKPRLSGKKTLGRHFVNQPRPFGSRAIFASKATREQCAVQPRPPSSPRWVAVHVLLLREEPRQARKAPGPAVAWTNDHVADRRRARRD